MPPIKPNSAAFNDPTLSRRLFLMASAAGLGSIAAHSLYEESHPQLQFYPEGVLLMELVVDAEGNAAPRLNDVEFPEALALSFHAQLIVEVVRMLCAGIIHGDLSEFNILVAADGPVIIDLPQAVDAAGNNHAEAMLERDVSNLRNFFGRFAPALLTTNYGKEIWALFSAGKLTPETELTGRFHRPRTKVDLDGVLREIVDVELEQKAKLARMQVVNS